MNKVWLTGRLTQDVELKTTQTGKEVASFSIAVDRYNDGVDFINCVVWGKMATNLAKYQGKGSLIGVLGRLQVRDYEDTKGNKKYITEVNVEEIEFLGTRKEPSTSVEEKNPFEEFGNNLKTETNAIDIQPSDLPF